MSKRDFSKDVNRVTKQITSIITLKNISKQEFFNDVNNLKSNQIGIKDFKNKYSDLFNGNIAKFKNKDSFLGSYKRNINPNYYKQSKSKDVINFNAEFRTRTIYIPKVEKKQISTKKVSKSEQISYKSDKNKFKSHLRYNGFAEKQINNLTNVYDLQKIKKNKLFGSQEVQLQLNYNTFFYDNDGFKVYIAYDNWITFRSKLTKEKSLKNRLEVAKEKMIDFIVSMQQSDYQIEIIGIYTHVYRYGD